ncbi:MAG: hypothetical protein JSW00_04475 [Thermoplasmata archaeon]|nr:MAG: hypothetical protein JSW00_04475 [Thermoplasmata archaeon]
MYNILCYNYYKLEIITKLVGMFEKHEKLLEKNPSLIKNKKRPKKHRAIWGGINNIGLFITNETADNLKYRFQKG